MVVLDEADEMLNMGFVDDIETILNEIPKERQTILFSATMPSEVLEITKKFQTDPITVEIKNAQMTVSTVEQYYFNVPKGRKNAALYSLLEFYNPKSAIIFCNTKKMVDDLIKELRKHGFPAQGLHGDMRQASRTQVMSQFKDEKFGILVATDVAARGIDVNDIKIVFNYDLPQEDEYYVHRIGRTGRAGKAGQAFSFVQGNKQLSQLKNIMSYTKCVILQKPLPTADEIAELKVNELSKSILTFMGENDYSAFSSAVERLMGDTYSAIDVAAAMFAMSIKKNTVNTEIATDFDDPLLNDYSSEEAPRRHRKSTEIVRRTPKVSHRKTEYNDENMVGVKISIGRRDKISPNHILGAVAGETGLPGSIFGNIDIQNTFTIIQVPRENKPLVVQKLNNSKIKGKSVKAN
ncbi:MAG: ATP-dependent RNA helicase [Firmicutes bacterium HGW-Firmicutes-21]|nr:MAG: ATP-dependent RNA helicase [Firmicutes bacterium HGW-Firmicutes-21]